MLRVASYDIVFQEVPGQVTLALNLSCCPNRCPGCHSPHLREAIGETLDETMLTALLERYGKAITCVCFMGGDGDPAGIVQLAAWVRQSPWSSLKTAWYSGRSSLPAGFDTSVLDYIKLGPYVESLGGLDRSTTNQRFFQVTDSGLIDITYRFQKENNPIRSKDI